MASAKSGGGQAASPTATAAGAQGPGSGEALRSPQPTDPNFVLPKFEGPNFLRFVRDPPSVAGNGSRSPGSAAHSRDEGSPPGGKMEKRNRPLRQLTVNLLDSYSTCRSDFRYQTSLNPRRCLTKPSEVVGESFDNSEADLVIYVNDELVSTASGKKYVVLDKLGQGTFGQVVKCQEESGDVFAVKVVRNKPAYTNQALVENMILSMVNQDRCGHVVKYYECFTHRNHLCLVMELLSVNLYELLRQNNFKGLSLNLIRVIMRQCLEALKVLETREIVHCDLKPENVMLRSITSPQIKVIDFGSACFENQSVYTYIQSRFYRSPEVLLRLPYDSGIDLWSLGCIGAELYLGLPLWPGTSEYNQMCKIVESLGMPPAYMLQQGKWTHKFFNVSWNSSGEQVFDIKHAKQFEAENSCELPKERRYFKYTDLNDLIQHYPYKKGLSEDEVAKEKDLRRKYAHFLKGILQYDQNTRWTANECLQHPFVTNSPHDPDWQPPQDSSRTSRAQKIAKSSPVPRGNGAHVNQTPPDRAMGPIGPMAASGPYGMDAGMMHPPFGISPNDMDAESGEAAHFNRLSEQFAMLRQQMAANASLLGASPGGTKYPPFQVGSIGQQRGLPTHPMQGMAGSPGGMLGTGSAAMLGTSPGNPLMGTSPGSVFGGSPGQGFWAGMAAGSPYGSPNDQASFLSMMMQQQSLGANPWGSPFPNQGMQPPPWAMQPNVPPVQQSAHGFADGIPAAHRPPQPAGKHARGGMFRQGSGGKSNSVGGQHNNHHAHNSNDFGSASLSQDPNSPGMFPNNDGWTHGRGVDPISGKVPEMAPERAGSGRRRQRGNDRRRGRGNGQGDGKGKGKGKEPGGSCGSSSNSSPLASPRAMGGEGLLFPIEPGGDTGGPQ